MTVDDLGYTDDGITHVTARFGFQDDLDVPATLRSAAERLEREADFEHVSYFLSRITIIATDAPGMARWRKKLFIAIVPQLRQPRPLLPPARRADRGDGLTRRAVSARRSPGRAAPRC